MKRGGRDGGLAMELLSVCAGVVLCIAGWTAIQNIVSVCLRNQRRTLRDAYETQTGALLLSARSRAHKPAPTWGRGLGATGVAGEEAAVHLLGP